jgi:pimeloyl-ACP methyl ester carboxylesterase
VSAATATDSARPAARSSREPELEHVELHGHRVGFLRAGSGPLIVLVHGITSSSDVWRPVIRQLADRFTVVAPDLLGHGRSAKPRGDYSLGAYASGIRDLLGVLGYERGTAVGHSLGGGVAMQFAYQFPEYCERLVLVSSGGLGRDVHPLLRAATLPGSEAVLPVITHDWALRAGEAVGGLVERLGLKLGPDVAEFARGYASLADGDARAAFLHTLRSVIEPGGQRVSALDRLYLAEQMPLLIIWGKRDPIIPVEQGRYAHALVSNSRLVEIDGAGHFPMLDAPDQVADELAGFVSSTPAYEWSLDEMRQALRTGPSGSTA